MHLNWFDYLCFAILFLSLGFGLYRGFIRSVLGLFTWLASFAVSFMFTHKLAVNLEPYVQSASVRAIICFFLLFIATFILGEIISVIMGRLVAESVLSSADRLLGLLFGVVRGFVIIFFLVFILSFTPMTETDTWRQSAFLDATADIVQQMKDKFVIIKDSTDAIHDTVIKESGTLAAPEDTATESSSTESHSSVPVVDRSTEAR